MVLHVAWVPWYTPPASFGMFRLVTHEAVGQRPEDKQQAARQLLALSQAATLLPCMGLGQVVVSTAPDA